LEDASRTALRATAPSSWAIEDVIQDYGVDLKIEVFDDSGAPTGEIFLVQLKATDEEDLARALRVRLKVEHLAYYATLDLPVLLVRFHAPTGALYAKWVHTFDVFDQIDDNPEQETITLSFTEDDRWDGNTPTTIRSGINAFRDFRANRLAPPIRFRFQIDPRAAPGTSPDRLALELREAARAVRGVVEFDDALESPCPTLYVGDNAMFVDLAGVSRTTFRHTQYAEGDLIDRFRADAFIAIAMAFATLGQSAMASRLTEEFLPDSVAVEIPTLVAWLTWSFVLSSRFREAIEVADRLAEVDDAPCWSGFEVITGILTLELHRMSDRDRSRYEQLLVDVRRRVAGDPEREATASYNLGNFLRNAGRPDEALGAYEEAAAKDPRYLEHGYFRLERAGLLFGMQRYSEAVVEYQQAIDLGEDDVTPTLLADALLFAGSYAEAEARLENVLATADDADGEWRLKVAAIRHIRATTGLDSQERSPHDADQVSPNLVSGDPAATLAISADVLRFDALNPYAWSHRAVALLRSGSTDRVDVGVSYLIAALLLEDDPLAWASAVVVVQTEPALRHLFEDAVRTAYRFCHHDFIVRLGDFPHNAEVLEAVDSVVAATNERETVSLRAPSARAAPDIRVERPR
jgi:tetratricopeptide (TPR) repeat protein